MLRNRLTGVLALTVVTTVGCGPGGTDGSPPRDITEAVPSAFAAPVTPSPSGLPWLTWYPDADGDQHGAASGLALSLDHQPDGYVASHDDCDDRDPAIHPGATEYGGNGVDDDCDGRVDEWDDFSPAP